MHDTNTLWCLINTVSQILPLDSVFFHILVHNMLFVQRKTEKSVICKIKKFKDSQPWKRVFLIALFMINCIMSIPDKSKQIFQGFC